MFVQMSTAGESIHLVLDHLKPVSLDVVSATADLLVRYDTKYLVPIELLGDLYSSVSSRVAILEHGGQRVSRYETTYYDTPTLRSYHDHSKGRRKRFKIRIRRYSSGAGYLEAKVKLPRGQTRKIRWPVGSEFLPDEISGAERNLVDQAMIDEGYDVTTEPLVRTMDGVFERVTLFDEHARERITIDHRLTAALSRRIDQREQRSLDLGRYRAIVEVKSRVPVSNTHRELSRAGFRPVDISKFCASMSLLEPELPGARWRPATRMLMNPVEYR